MSQSPTIIGGILLPSDSPTFLALLAVHVAAGVIAAGAGVIAMLSKKGPGRHPSSGTVYFWSLSVVFITMTVLSALRWAEDYHLFILGALSFDAAFVGRRGAPSRSFARVRVHVACMGLSYVLLLTAFYVDNGQNLPIWRDLPHVTYWLMPLVIGIPIIVRVLLVHPLVRGERRGH